MKTLLFVSLIRKQLYIVRLKISRSGDLPQQIKHWKEERIR